jgi:ferrous iron transport protein A
MRLEEAPIGRLMVVRRVVAEEQFKDLVRQLEEIGFLPNEQVMVLNKVMPGGDPIAVRIGLSTFALRKMEAHCIEVESVDRLGCVGR